MPERRAAVIHSALTVVVAVGVFFITVNLYVPVLSAIQSALGAFAYDHWGANGNTAAAFVATAAVVILSLIAAIALRAAANRVERSLSREKRIQATEVRRS